MASKRKASGDATPGWATPLSGEDEVDEEQVAPDDSLGQAVLKNVGKFDIGAFPYSLPARTLDSAARYFFPEQHRDFTALALKPDHQDRPLRIDGWGKLYLENFHPLAPRVQDFLITVAEPVSRPTFIHEYRLTAHSLYAAVSVGLTPKDILSTLDRFLKNEMPPNVASYVMHCGQSYGKVKLVLRDNKYFVETADPAVLQMLLKDPEIGPCRVMGTEETVTAAPKAGTIAIAGSKEAAGANALQRKEAGKDLYETADQVSRSLVDTGNDEDEQEVVHSFRIQDTAVGKVTERCLALHYPALEEYDFRNDHMNADLDIDLRPNTQIRPYQEKSLSKMFGNGRAKSGIIVLPCGAGKTLVGVTAACTIKKGVVILATSTMSVIQWRAEFLKWSNINPDSVAVFSSDQKNTFDGNTGIIVTTYAMVTNARKRSHDSAKMMDFLKNREWGLMLLDEVHVVPANMFRRVVGTIKAHSKLGLTATLLREDDKIEDLNFLIGPKLYEANWMELSEQGFIARVQCAEVWCPMSPEFYEQYLAAPPKQRLLFCATNPTKFQACQYLIKYHEARGDKIIVFSDDVAALKMYAFKLERPFLYGDTSESERQQILELFRSHPETNTLFLSKIGDTSLDLPEATCLIQISSQYGSRRQEAQRLGRILRAKRRNEAGFNAFFYTLVSKDTAEMNFASKRQAFLADQGYAFKVITQLKDLEKTPGLAFATAQERRELLLKVLNDKEHKALVEAEKAALEADGNMFYGTDGRPMRRAARRTAGMLSDYGGGQNMAYVEQNRSANRALKAKGKANPTSKFFQGVRRESEKRRKAA
ncbi:hypothetical protein RB594_002924 [Gaeumannomyces avenae]